MGGRGCPIFLPFTLTPVGRVMALTAGALVLLLAVVETAWLALVECKTVFCTGAAGRVAPGLAKKGRAHGSIVVLDWQWMNCLHPKLPMDVIPLPSMQLPHCPDSSYVLQSPPISARSCITCWYFSSAGASAAQAGCDR